MTAATLSARPGKARTTPSGAVRRLEPPTGWRETVLALLLRGALRVGLKPFLGPPWPFAVQRAALAIGSSLMPQDGRATVKADRIKHIPVERIVPKSAVRAPNAILYMHGGAFVAGSPRTHRSITRRLCALTGAEVLVPHYRLAPEHPFPAQIEDGVTAYKQLLADGYAADRIAIAGDSAGGQLTLMVTVALRQAGLPLPAAMVMMSPAFSLAPLPNSTAYERESRDPMIRQGWAQDVERALRIPHDHPLAEAMQQDLRGLPPALVQVGEDEVLFDNAPWYNDAATQAGSKSELEIYAKRWHVFQAHAGLMPSADQALARQAAFLQRCWGR
ncbi:MAG: Abhydrolase 3 protein [Pseudomonadota bacterium]|jgi:monoterpene epsilon-lactone hydrolase|nr:Abhydrolase 3 protein [Pseudomonadota bacterium]